MALPVGMRRVLVDTPSCKEIRDLASLRRDLLLASSFLDLYVSSDIEQDRSSPSPIDALWIAAVTMYGRAFATGQRQVGLAKIDSANSIELDNHNFFIDLRNKYIAHAANGFEVGAVFADLSDPAQPPLSIVRVGEAHTSLSRLSRERAETLGGLCQRQIAQLNARIDELHQVVVRELADLGADAAYSLEDFVPARIDGSNPRSRRR
jgi:hypothetical protein